MKERDCAQGVQELAASSISDCLECISVCGKVINPIVMGSQTSKKFQSRDNNRDHAMGKGTLEVPRQRRLCG